MGGLICWSTKIYINENKKLKLEMSKENTVYVDMMSDMMVFTMCVFRIDLKCCTY